MNEFIAQMHAVSHSISTNFLLCVNVANFISNSFDTWEGANMIGDRTYKGYTQIKEEYSKIHSLKMRMFLCTNS